MLRRIDDFLIDRVFQPIADSAARFVSCYGIAAFLLTGFGLEHLAFYVYGGHYVMILISACWLVPMTRQAYRLDRDPPRGMLPAERVTRFTSRMSNLIIIVPLSVLSVALVREAGLIIDAIGWVSLVPAECFMACRANPPKRREARAPRWMAQVRGAA